MTENEIEIVYNTEKRNFRTPWRTSVSFKQRILTTKKSDFYMIHKIEPMNAIQWDIKFVLWKLVNIPCHVFFFFASKKVVSRISLW